MFVSTNHIDIEPYRLKFEAIYSEHSADWVKRRSQSPYHGRGPGVILGLCRVWEDPQEQIRFLEYIATITKESPAIPYTISEIIVSEDPVAGYHPYILMDPVAKSKLDRLHNTLFSGRFSKHVYLEEDAFVAGASLGWIHTLEEATAIVHDLNRVQAHITGWIDTLVVYGLNTATRQYHVLKEFKLAKGV